MSKRAMHIYFPDKPDVSIPEDGIALVTPVYNEFLRLPYFIEYHKRLGVTHFFIIDNNSTDETRHYCQSVSNCYYFYTDTSYNITHSGREWTEEICNYYCNDRWVLTLDADELFIFPGHEFCDLRFLTRYLDNYEYKTITTAFIDFYSDKTLSETTYSRGENFLNVCPYFDGAGYTIHPGKNFPYMQIKGGPRQRTFWKDGGADAGPSMRKLPLVKWRHGFSYYFSTHSCTPTTIADFTAITAHFKFFSSFKEVAKNSVQIGNRTQTNDYVKYHELTDDSDINFLFEYSVKYMDSFTFSECGYIYLSENYKKELLRHVVAIHGVAVATQLERRIRFAEVNDRSTISLSQFRKWREMMGNRGRFEFLNASLDRSIFKVTNFALPHFFSIVDVELEIIPSAPIIDLHAPSRADRLM